MRWAFRLLVAVSLSIAGRASALGPHQVALIINGNSAASMTLANHYAALQNIPLENRIYVDLPPSALQAQSQLSDQAFLENVIHPVQEVLKQRGLEDRILAWLYSGDFPVLIQGAASTSLTGYTYFQGQLPSPAEVSGGRSISRFFAGEQDQKTAGYPFIAYRQTLKETMPVPSMLLAHLGARGLTLPQAIRMIERSRQAEGSRPKGTVYFEEGADIRAKTRAFQFADAIESLAQVNVEAKVIEGLPLGKRGVLGVMAGRMMVPPRGSGEFRPGAYCDHLTSFAADFDLYHHTKCTDWLRFGASGTSGPVVEPMAIWTKFPSARLFEFYARGFTMIESLYLATGSPWQTLFMGDPLCIPFNQRLALTLLPISGDILRGRSELQGHPLSPVDPRQLLWRVSIDGVPQGGLSPNPKFELDTTPLTDGAHRFGVEAYVHNQPLQMGYAELSFEVSNHGRKAVLELDGRSQDSTHPFSVTAAGEGGGDVVGLDVNGRLHPVKDPGNGNVYKVTLSPAIYGEGPVILQAVVRYEDGMLVRSMPQTIELKNLNRPPAVTTTRTRPTHEQSVFTARAVDPDGDQTRVEWFAQVLNQSFPSTQKVSAAKAVLDRVQQPEKLPPVGLLPETLGPIRGLRARMWPRNFGIDIASADRFGLVYHYQAPGTFSFFGYGGANGSWVMADISTGVWTVRESLGRPVFMNTEYHLELGLDEEGMLIASVDGTPIFRTPGQEISEVGRCGVLTEQYSLASKVWINADALPGCSVKGVSGPLVIEASSDPSICETLEVRVRDDRGAEHVKEIK